MQRLNPLRNRLFFVLIILSTCIFFQCDTFFTFSPLSGLLARDPVNLSRTEKYDYAKAALAARNTTAMQDALFAMELHLAAPPTASEYLLMGQIAMVLSGMEAQISDIITAFESLPDLNPLNTIITGFLPNKTYVQKGADYYYQCEQAGGTSMSGTDYFLGTMLIMFDGAIKGGEPVDLAVLGTTQTAYRGYAHTLCTNGINNLNTNDPDHMAKPLLEGIDTMLHNLGE